MNAEEIFRIILYVSGTAALVALLLFLLRAMRFLTSAQQTVEKLTSDVGKMQVDMHATLESVQSLTTNADHTVANLNSAIDGMNEQLSSVVQNVNSITSHARSITGDAADTVRAAKNSVMSVIDLKDRIEHAVHQPIGEITTILGAVAKAIRVFRTKLLGPDPEPEPEPENGYMEYRSELEMELEQSEDV